MRVGAIDLDSTLGCGQVFRWRKEGDTWKGILDGKEVGLRQRGGLRSSPKADIGRRGAAALFPLGR
jgi:hypothetical protein